MVRVRPNAAPAPAAHPAAAAHAAQVVVRLSTCSSDRRRLPSPPLHMQLSPTIVSASPGAATGANHRAHLPTCSSDLRRPPTPTLHAQQRPVKHDLASPRFSPPPLCPTPCRWYSVVWRIGPLLVAGYSDRAWVLGVLQVAPSFQRNWRRQDTTGINLVFIVDKFSRWIRSVSSSSVLLLVLPIRINAMFFLQSSLFCSPLFHRC